MKEVKTLNKILSAVIILCASIILIYGFGVALIGGSNPEFMFEINWGVAGPIALFLVGVLVTTIVKLVKVTVPTLKGNSEKKLAKAGLAMDIIVLIGVLLLVIAVIAASHKTEDWSSRAITLMTLILEGVPFVFVGSILSAKLIKNALN